MSTTCNNQQQAMAPVLSVANAQLKAIELHALIKKMLITEEWPRGRAGDLKRAHDEVKAAVDAFESLVPLLREATTYAQLYSDDDFSRLTTIRIPG